MVKVEILAGHSSSNINRSRCSSNFHSPGDSNRHLLTLQVVGCMVMVLIAKDCLMRRITPRKRRIRVSCMGIISACPSKTTKANNSSSSTIVGSMEEDLGVMAVEAAQPSSSTSCSIAIHPTVVLIRIVRTEIIISDSNYYG